VLRAVVGIADLPCDAPRWWVERRHRQAPGEIRRAMELFGYYNAEVEAELGWEASCWQASYTVAAGEPVRIERFDLSVEGDLAEQARLRAAVDGIRLGRNRIFTHQAYESAKDDLLEAAQALGYFDAGFTRHRVTIDAERNRADIELTLEGGERYRIGEVEIEQSVLNDALFRRYLRFSPGDPYDSDRLTLTYRHLLESDYFDRVFVAPEFDLREHGAVPVRITASASTRRTALVGAGYATDTGPRGRVDLRYRKVNDAGHRAEFRSVISAVAGELRAEYRLPYGDPTTSGCSCAATSPTRRPTPSRICSVASPWAVPCGVSGPGRKPTTWSTPCRTSRWVSRKAAPSCCCSVRAGPAAPPSTRRGRCAATPWGWTCEVPARRCCRTTT
jgi:translocation and assembly module TamA